MSFLSRWFGPQYNDEALISRAKSALENDPLISDPAAVVVTSEKGVVTLSGRVSRAQEVDRIEGVVRDAFTKAGVKHERLINDLKVAQTTT